MMCSVYITFLTRGYLLLLYSLRTHGFNLGGFVTYTVYFGRKVKTCASPKMYLDL